MPVDDYSPWLDAAIEQAEKSWEEGGIPIGSVLVNPAGTIVARGHNERVQSGDPTAHAEVVCVRHAGRRRDRHLGERVGKRVLRPDVEGVRQVVCAGDAEADGERRRHERHEQEQTRKSH